MTAQRRTPQTPEELLADVLAGLEMLGESTAAMVASVTQQTANIDRLAAAIARRPTNRALVGVLAVMAAFLMVIWVSLGAGQQYIREQVEAGDGRQCEAVRSIVNDGRSYHGQPEAPPCPVRP